jgi:hypothetical protein
VTMLPSGAVEPLKAHLEKAKALHRDDLANGYGEVYLPHALERKYPNAGRSWASQYVFPAASPSADPRSGVIRQHHGDEKRLQRAIKTAVEKVGIPSTFQDHDLHPRPQPRRQGCQSPLDQII